MGAGVWGKKSGGMVVSLTGFLFGLFVCLIWGGRWIGWWFLVFLGEWLIKLDCVRALSLSRFRCFFFHCDELPRRKWKTQQSKQLRQFDNIEKGRGEKEKK